MNDGNVGTVEYEAPSLEEIGTVRQVTQGLFPGKPQDGFFPGNWNYTPPSHHGFS